MVFAVITIKCVHLLSLRIAVNVIFSRSKIQGMKIKWIVWISLFIANLSFAQESSDVQLFVRLRTGEVHYFDAVELSKKQVIGTKEGKQQTFEAADCETALIGENKKNKLVIRRHVLFADKKTHNNLGGAASLKPGDADYNIVVRNGNSMIIYKPSIVPGGGVTGNQTIFYHIDNGQVSKIEFTEWRDDALMQKFVNDFGICPEVKKALQDFKSSGKVARQTKYEWSMNSIEKKYLLNCPDIN